ARVLAGAARALGSLAILPIADVLSLGLGGPHVAPLVTAEEASLLSRLPEAPLLIELAGWDRQRYAELTERFPGAVVVARVPMDTDLVPLVREGGRAFHLVADYHGRVGDYFARGDGAPGRRARAGVACPHPAARPPDTDRR